MVVKKKVLKKRWISMLASEEFNKMEIGESLAVSAEDLIGKLVRVSFADLSGDVKRQNITITFLVKGVEGEKAITEFISYELVSAFVKRITKVAKSKVEDSFVIKTKDGVSVRVKPLLLTNAKTHKSVLKVLRKQVREFLEEVFKQQDYKEIIGKLLGYKLQRDLREMLKKIYPVRTCDIRVFKKIR